VGAAQPGAATAVDHHGHADADDHVVDADHHPAAGYHHDDAAVRAADAAVSAAAAILPAEHEHPELAAAVAAAGSRSSADFATTGRLTSLARKIHRYTGVP
jgi:hypothetical protein